MTLLRVNSSAPTPSSPPPATTNTPLSLKKVWRYFNRSFHSSSSSSKHSPHGFHTLSTSTTCPPHSLIESRGHSSLALPKKSPSDSMALVVTPSDRTSRIDEGFYQIVKPSYHDKAEPSVGSCFSSLLLFFLDQSSDWANEYSCNWGIIS